MYGEPSPAGEQSLIFDWQRTDTATVPRYRAEEHATWQALSRRQQALWPGRACSEYLDATATLGLLGERIPTLDKVSRTLHALSGWELARVKGIVPDDEFFAMLSRCVFPSTDFIRAAQDIDYTPAPDIFHDLVGHTPLLTHPRFGAFFQRFGAAGCKAFALDHPAREWLPRIYWYTVEFGLIQTGSGLRIYGAGILSSKAEVQYSLSAATRKHPLDLDHIAQTPYDVWHLQDTLFVIDSFDQLESEFSRWTARHGLS